MAGSRLSVEERIRIESWITAGVSQVEMATMLRRSASTISREITRNANQDGTYRARSAQRRADQRARRPKPCKLDLYPHHAAAIRNALRYHSPYTVAANCTAAGFPISHETIYRFIYRGGFGDPAQLMLRPRRRRKPRRARRGFPQQPLTNVASIHQRPDGIGIEPGHWEGDLLCGTRSRTACAVLVEAHTGLVELIALPEGQNSDHVTHQIRNRMLTYPTPLVRTLTWDRGRELAHYTILDTDIFTDGVYFCDPGKPYQKPRVENLCGRLRRFLPRNQNIPTDQATLETIARWINTTRQPRLNNQTPIEALTTLHIATTT